MRIREITTGKQVHLQTIAPDNAVHDAIKQLVRFNIGALPVVDESGRLVGIITERDILRLAARDDCDDALALPIAEVMTHDLVIGVLDDDVDYLMRVMTGRRIRHIPIIEDGRLVHIISIGDLVKAKGDAAETEIRFLRDYVSS